MTRLNSLLTRLALTLAVLPTPAVADSLLVGPACLKKIGATLPHVIETTTGLKRPREWYFEHTGVDLAKVYVASIDRTSTKMSVGILDNDLPFRADADPQPQYSYIIPTTPAGPATLMMAAKEYTGDPETLYKEGHSHEVATLLMGSNGASHLQKAISFVLHDSVTATGKAEKIYQLLRKKGLFPKVVNMSIALAREPVNPGDWDKTRINKIATWLAEQETIVVTGAGNTGAPMLSDKQDFPGIVVGGLLSNGRVWSKSSTGDKISIYAPAASLILIAPSGQLYFNEGTSLASPIVAGALIDTLEIMPDLKLAHFKLLLQRSAISIQQGNGSFVKALNAYKMIRVAKRIKDLVYSGRMNPSQTKSQYILDLLNNPELFNFSKEAKEEFRQAKTLGPSLNCEGQKILKHLRASFLLDQTNSANLELAAIYKHLGYSQDALFYSSTFGKVSWN
jgi:hypothetical protein